MRRNRSVVLLIAVGLITLPLLLAVAPVRAQGVSADDRTYLDQSQLLLTMMSTSTRAIGALFTEADVADPDWQDEAIGQTFVWVAILDAHDDLTPSRALRPVHDKTSESFTLMVSAGVDFRVGLRTFDAGPIASGNDKVTRATALLDEAVDMLNDLKP